MSAIIFDIDGTLIDNNELHVEAWRRAFAMNGVRLDRGRIKPQIGMGGDLLVPAILGEDGELRSGDAIREAHDKSYLDLCGVTSLSPTRGARQLLEELRRRGVPTAAATSAKPHELAATLRAARFPLDQLVGVIVTSEAADTSKPAPDVLAIASERLGIDPAECVVVGDTRHDGAAATSGGMAFVGLTCGGTTSSGELVAAGARGVFADPLELLDDLEDVLSTRGPEATAPSPSH